LASDVREIAAGFKVVDLAASILDKSSRLSGMGPDFVLRSYESAWVNVQS
jgi:hypothetical protein